MGLVQTISSYFYPNQNKPLSATIIKTKAQRLTLCLKQAQYKLQQATLKLEDELCQQLNQNKLVRNK